MKLTVKLETDQGGRMIEFDYAEPIKDFKTVMNTVAAIFAQEYGTNS